MKILFYILCFGFLTGSVAAQEEVMPKEEPFSVQQSGFSKKEVPQHAETEVFIYTDEAAEYPGGDEAMKKFITENFVYPQSALEKGIQGKVYLKFIVTDQGKITQVEVMRGLAGCPECDKEAVRLVKAMPDWIPAKMSDKAVSCEFTLPIVFRLQ